MRVGVVGAGLQANRRLAALGPNDEFVAVSAPSVDHVEQLIRRFGGVPADSWQELVRRDDVDAVIVASPPRSHRDISIAALRSGKHVLCEKPLAASSADATVMAEAAETAGRVLHCGFNHRFHPAIPRLRELLEAGGYGPVLAVNGSYGHGIRPGYADEWRCDPAHVSGGQLMEQGIHLVDLVDHMLGPVDRVVARLSRGFGLPADLEDDAHVLLDLRPGGVAFLRSSLAQWRNRFWFEVTCLDATLRVSGLGGSYGVETLTVEPRTDGPFRRETVEFRGADPSWNHEWQYFRALTGNSGAAVTDDAGRRALAIVEAAYRSATTDKWEEVDK